MERAHWLRRPTSPRISLSPWASQTESFGTGLACIDKKKTLVLSGDGRDAAARVEAACCFSRPFR
jgi:hypothetical protein